MTNSMTLYEIKEEYNKALAAVTVDEETGEIMGLEAVEELAAALDEKADAIACYIKDEKALAEALKAEEAALAARRKAHEKKAGGLQDYLGAMLTAAGKDKLETARAKLSFRRSEAVIVDNLDTIPAEYRREKVTVEADKTAIKAAIKDGVVVEGARLEERRSLQIK